MITKYMVIECAWQVEDPLNDPPQIEEDRPVEVYDTKEEALRELIGLPRDGNPAMDFRVLVSVDERGNKEIESVFGFVIASALKQGPRFWGLLNQVVAASAAEVAKHLAQEKPKE